LERTGPEVSRAIALDKDVGFGLIDDLRESKQLPGITGRATDVLEFEDRPDDFGDGILSE
jgi:hypothetical protein